MHRFFAISLLSLLAIYGCNQAAVDLPPEAENQKTTIADSVAPNIHLPAFKMVDVKGRPFNLAGFKGKKVFVNLWASWCPPCRAEIPSIEQLYNKVDKSKAAFVLLSLDSDFETAVTFAAEHKLASPVYYPAENLPSLFNVQGIPVTFVFDEEGALLSQIEGGDDYDTEKYLTLLNK